MVGLGKFNAPEYCKMCEYATYGVRYTFQPYWQCSHGCPSCYARYGWRWKYWGEKSSSIIAVDLEQVERDYLKLKTKSQIEASPSCDPFDLAYEGTYRITKKALETIFNQRSDIHFTWLTKSKIISNYVDILPKKSVPQITIESTKLSISSPYASNYEERLDVVGRLTNAGFSVGVRIDPIIPEWTSIESIYTIMDDVAKKGCKHITVSVIKLYKEQFELIEGTFGINLDEKLELKGDRFYFKEFIRLPIEQMIKDKCDQMGLTYATCMENLVQDTGYCDPFHLIENKNGGC